MPLDPTRFLDAQNAVYPQVLSELRAGQKRTHWMWFVFPQLAGLGHSPTSQFYALPDLAAAQDYLEQPVLGARLRECTEAVLLHGPDRPAPRTLEALLGYPDNLKFHSSMTLFHRAAPAETIFATALDAFFAGAEDAATLALLQSA